LGRIVNLSSGLARRVRPGLGPYSTTKAAVLQMSKVMDAENRERGVRVFAVEPGLVRTEMSKQLRALEGDGVQASVRRMLIRLVVAGESDENRWQPRGSAAGNGGRKCAGRAERVSSRKLGSRKPRRRSRRVGRRSVRGRR
jgi:NAD(P)-dependent dehydrogenase (short-subunit alcohol dehydrogenase family)